jgi:DNA-binding IclR family transcriptional regulator
MKVSDALTDRYRAPALDKGLDILELLAATDGGLSQAEIAKRLGRSHNELYRMLNTLVRRGYVARDEGDRFSLTLKLFGLAHLHAPVRRMASYATPMMRELAQATQQANQLVVFDRGSVVLIAQQEAPSYWGISIRMGSHVSLFDTGSGQVLLAFRPPEERLMMIAEHLRSNEEPSISPEFAARLDEIEARGYAMMPSIQIAGVMNLSAPVLRPDGRALAALTVPYVHLANVPSAPDMMDTLALIRATAARLSSLAGAGVPGQ